MRAHVAFAKGIILHVAGGIDVTRRRGGDARNAASGGVVGELGGGRLVVAVILMRVVAERLGTGKLSENDVGGGSRAMERIVAGRDAGARRGGRTVLGDRGTLSFCVRDAYTIDHRPIAGTVAATLPIPLLPFVPRPSM